MNKSESKYFNTAVRMDEALLELLEKKDFAYITVKEICEKAGVNRSTFYLHYTDIYQMLESIEDELEGEINQIVNNHPVDSYYKESFPMIKEILEVLWDNRDICNALLGSNGDMAFVLRMESIISQHSLHVLTTTFATDVTNIKYAYAFCLTGCVGMVKSWLESGDTTDTPLQMAELTYHLIMNALKDIKRLPSTTL